MALKNQLRKWKCPICGKKSFELVIDSYLQEILEHAREYEKDIKEVTLFPDGSYKLILPDDDNVYDSQLDLASVKA